MKVDLKKYQKDLKAIKCNLCGHTKAIVFDSESRFNSGAGVSICPKCSLIYISPRWSEKTYGEFYKHDYRILMGEGREKLEIVTVAERIHGAKILDFCHLFVNKGDSVLDIGSSAGGVLHIFKKFKNCRVLGIEPDLDRAKFCQNYYGIAVKSGLFEDSIFKKNQFDLVIMTQTMNHLMNPISSIKKIHSILKPEGKVFLEVQNFAETIKMFVNPTQVDHTYNFTPETLMLMLKKVGFDILNIEEDTAQSARLVSRTMWRLGANIHIRIIAQKAKPAKKLEYPDYHGVLREYKKYRRRTKSLAMLYTIKMKILGG